MDSYHPVVAKIEAFLTENGVSYEKFEHEPVKTSEEAAAVRPDFTIQQGTKALIIRIKKNGVKSFAMVALPGDKKFDSAKVREVLGASDIRFATPEEVAEITGGVIPGGVPPLGNLFGLPVVADEGVFQNERIIFNAGDRRVSITIRSSDYQISVNPSVRKIC
jgi:prolyl-tRNA editing enzyme YbaK/EbsC (Cys-tRNA(Pro) deacylase)